MTKENGTGKPVPQLVKKPFDKLSSLSAKVGRSRFLRSEAVQRYRERPEKRLICGNFNKKEMAFEPFLPALILELLFAANGLPPFSTDCGTGKPVPYGM